VACPGVLRFDAGELDREADPEQHAEHAVELAREERLAGHLRELVDRARPQVRAIGLREEGAVEAGHVHDQDAHQREAAQDVERGQPFGTRQRAESDGFGHGELRCGDGMPASKA